MLLADLTGDGIPDAVVTAREGRHYGIRVMRGNAAGSFDAPITTPGVCGNGVPEGGELCDDGNHKAHDGCSKTCALEIRGGVVSATAADLDADGRVDLVLVDAHGSVLALFGDGDGRFARVRVLAAARPQTPPVVADFDGDGAPDIAIVGKSTRAGLVVLRNNGQGTFTMRRTAAGAFTGPLLAGDFDGDGLTDVAVGVKAKTAGLTVLFNDGTAPARPAPVTRMPKAPVSLAAADFDEDGRLDLLADLGGGDPPLLLQGNGTGSFTSRGAVTDTGGSAHVIVDLDGDRHQDIVACGDATTPLCRVRYGDGKGGFFGAPAADEDAAVDAIGNDIFGAGGADFDGDGFVDLVGISREDNRARIVFRNDDRAKSAMVELPAGSKPGRSRSRTSTATAGRTSS